MTVGVLDNNVKAVGIGAGGNHNVVHAGYGSRGFLILGNGNNFFGIVFSRCSGKRRSCVIDLEGTAHLFVIAPFETHGDEVIGVGI